MYSAEIFYTRRFSVGTFGLSENVEEIVKLVEQKPDEILQNLAMYEDNRVQTQGDYALHYTLKPQENNLPLFGAFLQYSQKPTPNSIYMHMKVLFQHRVDQLLTRSEINAKLAEFTAVDQS